MRREKKREKKRERKRRKRGNRRVEGKKKKIKNNIILGSTRKKIEATDVKRSGSKLTMSKEIIKSTVANISNICFF